MARMQPSDHREVQVTEVTDEIGERLSSIEYCRIGGMKRSTNVMQCVRCRDMLNYRPICRNGGRIAESTQPPLCLVAGHHLPQNLTILALLHH